MSEMADIFGEGGLFARKVPGFVHRPDQLRMAAAVAALLADGENEHGLTQIGRASCRERV